MLLGYMKKSGCLSLVLFLALCGSLFCNVLFLVMLGAKTTSGMASVGKGGVLREPKYEEYLLAPGSSSEKVAVIPLTGLIAYSQPGDLGNNMVQDLTHAFQQAAEDQDVKAVVLLVDSPGGEMTAGDAIYHEVEKLKTKKPVVVYMTSLGASAAYYISCASSWIMANESTFTGSIGVIISTLNYENLFEKIGLQAIVFKSGKFKDMLSGSRPLSEDEREYVQTLVMQAYDRFLKIVSTNRNLDAEQLRNGIADGRVLTGLDAYREKLVDQLGYVEDAYQKARELGGAPNAQVVQYKPRIGLARLFQLFGESKAPQVSVNLFEQRHRLNLEPGRVYLLPSLFVP